MAAFKIYLDDQGQGFALGNSANIVPQDYVDEYTHNMLNEFKESDFSRVYKKFNVAKLKTGAALYARRTENNSLILI